jgi:hypothetical protein
MRSSTKNYLLLQKLFGYNISIYIFLLIKQKKLAYFITQVYSQMNCRVEMNISILITKLNLVEKDSFYSEPGYAVPFKASFLYY